MPICYFTLWITNPFAFWMGCNFQGRTQLWVKTISSREVHPTSTEGPENHCFGDHVGTSMKMDHNVQDRQLDPLMKWDSWWEPISVLVALRSLVPTLRLLRLWMQVWGLSSFFPNAWSLSELTPDSSMFWILNPEPPSHFLSQESSTDCLEVFLCKFSKWHPARKWRDESAFSLKNNWEWRENLQTWFWCWGELYNPQSWSFPTFPVSWP